MYYYYENSAVCYVHLEDVEILLGDMNATHMQNARWIYRGWWVALHSKHRPSTN
jgi:hypothetical protein